MTGATVEVVRALAVLAERPGPGDGHERVAAALGLSRVPDEVSWTQVFVFNFYPHASVYLGGEGQVGGEAADRVAGFFRALDAVPPPEPDALVTLLSAWAQLAERADGADGVGDDRAAHALASLLDEHLLPWLPLVLARMEALAPEPWPSWVRLCGVALRTAPLAPARGLPIHLRAAPTFEDPRSGDASLVEQLLVPVRAGFVLTTADLRRAAHETGLPLRLAERRYVLGQLLGQSVPTTLRWLADHGQSTTAAAWEPWQDTAPLVANWWTERAAATASLLRELAREAEEAIVRVP